MVSLRSSRRASGVARLFLVAVGLAAVGLVRAGEDPHVYVKQATWAETMLATRERYARTLAESAPGRKQSDARPFISDRIAGDGPGQAISVNVSGQQRLRLMTVLEEGVGNCTIWGEPRLVSKDGTVTPLGALKPTSVQVGWGQLLQDKNWQDHPLQIGEKRFKHGLWVHTNSDVCYALDGKYERFEAWVGIDIDRPTGAARFKVLFDAADPLPWAWQQMEADFPTQTHWLSQDMGGRQLDWFYKPDARQEQALVERALGQAGPAGEPLRADLAALRQANAGPADRRWLDLYARACRARDCAGPIRQLPSAELQAALFGELLALARSQAPEGDARWPALQARAAKLREALGDARAFDTASLQRAVDDLAGALPGRFADADGLRRRAPEYQKEWRALLPALARGDDAALKQAPALRKEIQGFRHALLARVRGVAEYLAADPVGLEKEWESQFETLQYDLGNRAQFARFADTTYRRDALILDTDRDPADVVLRRTGALLADLKRTPAAARLAGPEKELAELQAAGARIPVQSTEARYALFALACKLRRQVAFSNPLLDFDKLLFIKRHRSTYDHMCDQFYGSTARPGGGLFVLSDPFGPAPKLRDVLADSVVTRGRLKGEKLESGAFLSPALSFDGKSVLFAYVECRGKNAHDYHTDPTRGHWAPGWSYHIFKVGADGKDLQQITDGTWNDFAPCWLPNGRIAFISERRGGYLRCGRVCPTYTLFDMAADGSDINCLSFHETNEWAPSVTHSGRIIYTRWDYVDRHGCTAHLPWITTPDGRDSRAVHGNFAPRNLRPDMELDVRAVPGSDRYIATAAPHHGQAFGSLVLVDPNVEDDDAMAPVKRLTPDVGFPESQGGREAYGTAWPLSDDYYLCAYDAGRALGRPTGNKELIYRDPEIACTSPMPLRATPEPPVMPDDSIRDAKLSNPATRPANARSQEATIALVNVYDSLHPWPDGTKIKSLRVLQVLPMTVPSGAPPFETGLRVATAGDSVVPARAVLGTVPVEADGSAYFKVPANKEMFFQALDERGEAVQSMRSATYLHEGERLVCQGCHENRYRAPRAPQGVPIALRHAPATLAPDVDGSNPFSYPRLVQPVLDKQCVSCHAQHRDKAPNLGREPIQQHWYASYVSLVSRYGFTSYGGPMITTPGRFGARASKLMELLDQGHYGVKLSEAERHRLTLWLDCSSMFYGVYEKEGGEAQLRGEIAKPTLE